MRSVDDLNTFLRNLDELHAPSTRQNFFSQNKAKCIASETEWKNKLLLFADFILRLPISKKKADTYARRTYARRRRTAAGDRAPPCRHATVIVHAARALSGWRDLCCFLSILRDLLLIRCRIYSSTRWLYFEFSFRSKTSSKSTFCPRNTQKNIEIGFFFANRKSQNKVGEQK